MLYQVTAVKLDGSQIVASIVSNNYDVEVRLSKEDVNQYLIDYYDFISLPNYWRACEIDDFQAKSDVTGFISQSPLLLSTLADAVKLKEIEAILYDDISNGHKESSFEVKECDHLHALITQYADMRVKTELLKLKTN